MDEESKPPTTFTVGPLGFYESDRMPFGLTNGPAIFQWLMETCLRDLILNWCRIYLDDIVTFSKDLASHLMKLEAVFQKLEPAGLKLEPSKCDLFCKQITCLGHISSQGIATDEKKIYVIKKWPTSTTATEVQSFLRFTMYYHWFIPKSADCLAPAWIDIWQKHRQEEGYHHLEWQVPPVDELKCLCTMVLILAYANFTKPFKLHINACGSGLGPVLYQVQDSGNDTIISYVSRSLTKA